MKKVIIILLVIQNLLTMGQNTKEKHAIRIENEKITFELPKDSTVAANLKKAIEEYWYYNDNYEFAQVGSCSDNSIKISIVLTTLTYVVREFSIKDELGSILKLMITIDKPRFSIGFSRFPELSYLDFVEIIKRSQFVLLEIKEEGSWNKAFVGIHKKYGKELKNKTLLVDTSLFKENISIEKFGTKYPYKFAYVSKEVIEDAIINNDKSKAYFKIVEEKVGIIVQYIVNAGTGKIYAGNYSKIETIDNIRNCSKNKTLTLDDIRCFLRKIR